MKTFIVVSAVGRDRPGLVNKLSHEIKINGGNIELQRSAKMADEFAIISLVSIEANTEKVNQFIRNLTSLGEENFFVYARTATTGLTERPANTQPGEIIAEGADQMGIIDNLTLLLYQNDINIESMEYDVKHAPMSGVPLFQMHAKIIVPEAVNIEQLKQDFRALENDLNIDILFRFPLQSSTIIKD